MLGARITGGDRRRPMLLALVFGVVLVLVGVTASALVAVASDHLANATLGGVVNRDATLVELFVNGELRADDLSSDGPGAARIDEVAGRLSALTERDGIVRIEIRDLDGTVLLSDERAIVGTDAGVTAGTRAAGAGEPMAALLEFGAQSGAAGGLPNPSGMVEEFLPINDGEGDVIAVVALWRDAADLMARLDATRRDIMLVTLAAAVILAGILFLVFRAAQSRLTRQTVQLIEATRRDPLTGVLNHGAVSRLLAEEIEARGTIRRADRHRPRGRRQLPAVQRHARP